MKDATSDECDIQMRVVQMHKKNVVVNNLYEVEKFLSKIPNINYGGCLVAAYAVYLWLKKNNQLEKDFYIIGFEIRDGEDLYKNNMEFIKGKDVALKANTHYGYTFRKGGRYEDTKGIINEFEYDFIFLIPQNITDEFCKNALNNGRWNPDFDREKHLPLIEETLKIKIL